MNSRVLSSVDQAQWAQARKYAQEACLSFQFSRKSKEEVRILIHLSTLVSNIFDFLDPYSNGELPDFDSISETFVDAKTPLAKFGLSVAVLLEKLLTDRIPCGSADSPLLEQDAHQNLVKTEPIDESPQLFDIHESEIKQEPLDIKEELLDDFELVKQEEPESEIFCPATGSSRPLDDMDFLHNEEINEDTREVSEEEEAPNRKSAAHKKRRSAIGSTSKNAIFANPTLPPSERRRLCHLCKQRADSLRKFPANSRPVVQEQWIERLDKNVDEAKRMLAIYRDKIDRGVDIRWCSEHFNSTSLGLPKDLRPLTTHPNRTKAVPELYLRPETRPRLLVRPLRPELQLERLQQRYINGLAAAAAAAATPKTIKAEKDSEVKRQGTPRVLHQKTTSGTPVKYPPGKRLKCDLCDDPDYPLHLSPCNNPLRAKTFLESLITQTEEEKDRVDAMLNKLHKEAKICSKHFWKETETAIVSPPLNKCAKPEKFDLVQSTMCLLQKKDQEEKTDTLQDGAQQTPKTNNKHAIKRKATVDLS